MSDNPLDHIPGAIPPDGQSYDLNFQPDNAPGIAFVTICLALVTFGGLLRIYSLVNFVKKVHVEDYIALAAFIPFLAVIAVFLRYIQDGGFYVHQWDISAARLLDGLSLEIYLFGIFWAACMLFIKPAVLLQWNRIFVPRGTRTWLYWGIHGLIVLNTLLYVAGLFATAFGCTPISGFWDASIQRKCISHKDLQITATSFNAGIDIAIFLLPQRMIWSMQMTTGRKIGLALMFSVGLLSIASALGHVHSIPFVNFSYPTVGDSTWTTSPLFIWCLAEVTGVFLIYLIPSAPRALGDAIGESEPFKRLRSWTRRMSEKSTSTIVKAWPRTIGSAPGTQVHRLADEDGQAFGLAELRIMQELNDSASIMKTTVVDQREDPARKTLADDHKRQHPWMEERAEV